MDVPDFRGTHAPGFHSDVTFVTAISAAEDLAIRDESELKLQVLQKI